MKRSNEFAVGLAVLAALALVIGGALWLSETDVNQKQASYKARFRTVGGLGVGAPVTLRGVKVGRVEAIRLVENEWVETDFSIDRYRRAALASRPPSPRPPACSASGAPTSFRSSQLPTTPSSGTPLIESDAAGGDAWPGATLPDIGAADRAGQPDRRRHGRHHPADRAGLRQHRPQEHAAERQGPRRDLRTAGQPSPTPRATEWIGSAGTWPPPRTPSPEWPGRSRVPWPGWTPPPATTS